MGMQVMNGACGGASVTCKCPWYILSAQPVADLSVCGCLDLFRTCGADCRTRSRGHGAELAELSSLPGAEADTFCGIPLRGDSEARRSALSPFPPRSAYMECAVRWLIITSLRLKSSLSFADVRDPPSLRYFLFVLVSSSPLHLLLHLFFLAGVVSVWTLLGLRSPLITDSSFLFCQQLPVTQPSGASSSADVLHKEAHKNICLPAQGI